MSGAARLWRAAGLLLGLACAAIQVSPLCALPQDLVDIPPEMSCARCRIVATAGPVLGHPNGPGAIGPLAAMARTPDERYFVVYHPVDYEVVSFSSDGSVAEPFGRRGDGPGEFQSIRWMESTSRSLHVFDARHRRWTVLDRDMAVIGTAHFAGVPLGDFLPLDDSTAVLNAMIMSRDRAGFLLHIVSRSDGAVHSFEEHVDGSRPGVSGLSYWRTLAPSSSFGGFWSAHVTRYRLDRWSARGTLEARLARRVGWFPDHPRERPDPPDPGEPPLPRILSIREDADGLVWVLLRVASEDWATSLAESDERSHPEEGRYSIEDLNLSYDTVIEVIDPVAGLLVASATLDEALIDFVGEVQAVSASAESDPFPRLFLWTLALQRTGAG